MDAVREISELAEGGLRIAGRLRDERSRLDVAVGLGRRPCEAQIVRESEEPLLGAVVEVALEPAPLGISRLDDARARDSEVLELGQDLRLQALVLEREPDGGAHLVLELGDCGGVRDEGDSAAAAHERGDRAPGGGHGLLDRMASAVDVAPRGRKPVRDSELGIADRFGEGRLERARRRRLAQLGDDPGDGSPLDSGTEEAPRKAEADDDDCRAPGGEDGQERRVTRVLEGRANERGRMGDRRGREPESARQDRPHDPAGRGCRRGEPPDAERREHQCRGGGEPEVGLFDAPRDPRERTDEEDVVRAVVPAVGIEEGIAEERTAEHRESSFEVHGADERALTSRAQPAARVRENEVEKKREDEAGGKRAEAQDERRAALPAGPKRREPDNACEQGQVADPPRRAGEGHDEAGRHERKTGGDGKSGGEVGAPGVGRELARTARDGNRA